MFEAEIERIFYRYEAHLQTQYQNSRLHFALKFWDGSSKLESWTYKILQVLKRSEKGIWTLPKKSATINNPW